MNTYAVTILNGNRTDVVSASSLKIGQDVGIIFMHDQELIAYYPIGSVVIVKHDTPPADPVPNGQPLQTASQVALDNAAEV